MPIEYIGRILVMGLLLCFSAFFSGMETAFFNLSRRQIESLRTSEHRLSHLAARLLANQPKLLGCILFGNMTVNILYFAVSSTLLLRLEQWSVAAAGVGAVVFYIALVICGEIVPKSVSHGSSKQICVAVAVPMFFFVEIISPVVSVFKFLFLEPALRLILGRAKPASPVTAAEFAMLIEQIRKRGLITADENKLLTEVVELGFLKVRNVMEPRVDMVLCSEDDEAEKVKRVMIENGLTRVPVYRGNIDNIIGVVSLRQILTKPHTATRKLVEGVNFVPEQKKVENLLEFFRSSHTDMAIVVDEYGGIAGTVSLADIAEELIGPLEMDQREFIEQLGPWEYRLSGNLAVHEWAHSLDIDVEEIKASTIGGLVTVLLGKIPKVGDEVRLANLKFTVEHMDKHRIRSVVLTLEPIKSNDA